ncbi:MAG: isovaleryl-CoA dehydrogenase [Nitriliruptorales bacterium]|nr:isovaleryl-CoA dehydrogenase [Nitriliruptorales bacterium]
MPMRESTNQPPPLAGHDAFADDTALMEALHREGAGWAQEELHALGTLAGSAEAKAWGRLANTYEPVLHTHDRYGDRRDEVEFHPAYHDLMRTAVSHGLHAAPWADERPGAHVARAAKLQVWVAVEAGHGCPITMTYAAVPALRAQPEIAAEWEPRLVSRVYDPRFRPASEKHGALLGMGMTERQGGSDVRANTTRAEPLGAGGPGGEYALTGHKWFFSAPMCDGHLVLAQASGGLSCFLVPRWLPDGARNSLRLQRLKDKLGNRSNASSEVEFDRAWGRLIGEEGRGVATIIEMVGHTRLDCVIGSSAGMRLGVAEAVHHAAHRRAFGRELIDQPLMRNVLADLALESEAATTLAMRLARAYDAQQDAAENAFKRLATAVAKYWICKRAPAHAAEALECLGGDGYVEDSPMPRLLRESPLNGIWEGSGNVICLDVLRAMRRDPETVEAFFAEVGAAAGADARLDIEVAALRDEVADTETLEVRARRVVERMALVLQASLLVRHGHPAIADAFVVSRVAGDHGGAFGTLPAGSDAGTIIERARPKLN